MSQENNDVLTALNLMERVIPRLHGESRETIKRTQLNQISQSLSMVLRLITKHCSDPLVLTPIMEVVTLIESVTADESFVETDAETKELMVDRLNASLNKMYLFAGKFYMENEFTWSLTLTSVLRHLVDTCLQNGFYFGYDRELQEEGLI